ncbi:MAG: hypothetical protein GY789_02500 [Hyphomicrobiales bacterium]|nr:hypothetical protein [Hyphomicrobiales bacterium]MCP4997865.1 hypothetical protein [Hyphomicrobiales bacterium]
MSTDPFASLDGGSKTPARQNGKPNRRCVVPVPAQTQKPPTRHPKLRSPSDRWIYHDETGEVLGYVCRFEDKNGGKSFRPLCLFEGERNKPQWRWESWPAPRPLYGLDRLAAHPDAPVLICEGEKSADAA